MNHLAMNLECLARRQPDLALQLNKTETSNVRTFPSACGLPTAVYERNASVFPLHSRYDPMREARQSLKKSDPSGADYFVLLGFGMGYIMDALREAGAGPSDHYFIVESDLEILKAAFEARDLTEIISLPHIHFAWPASGPALAEQWRRFFDPVQAQENAFITHMPSVVLDPGLFKSAAKMIQSQIFQIFTDINTLVEKSQLFLDNFTANVAKAAGAPGVAKFSGIFSGTPAAIVSAGPSLDKNIHELRGQEEKLLILSTDTALKPLLASGIEPHFVLTGDPSYANYLHLKGAAPTQAFLVAEATSYPAVFDQFENRIITCIFENSSLRSLADLLGNKGTLRAWGSVATMALDFALLLQCDPIIFVGQDLAHTHGRLYCSGLCFDEEWFADVACPEGWRKKQECLRSSRRTVMMEDIFCRPVESTDKLTAYWNWIIKTIRDHPGVRFINATEGGILRDAVRIASLRETLHAYCHTPMNLRERIREAFATAQESSLFYPGLNFSALVGEAAAMQEALARGLRLCRCTSGYSPEDFIKRLEDIKEAIYYNPRIAPLVDCLNQMGNVTFLRSRNAILKRGTSPDILPEISRVYSEYFNAVCDSLKKIRGALLKIGTKLDLGSDLKSGLVGTRPARNRYSAEQKVSIS